MSKSELIELVLSAPDDRHAAIVAAIKASDRVRPGTARQAAELLGYTCTRSVYRLAARGELKPIRLSSRRIRFDLTECQRIAETGVQVSP
jgi:hypothetical protein